MPEHLRSQERSTTRLSGERGEPGAVGLRGDRGGALAPRGCALHTGRARLEERIEPGERAFERPPREREPAFAIVRELVDPLEHRRCGIGREALAGRVEATFCDAYDLDARVIDPAERGVLQYALQVLEHDAMLGVV